MGGIQFSGDAHREVSTMVIPFRKIKNKKYADSEFRRLIRSIISWHILLTSSVDFLPSTTCFSVSPECLPNDYDNRLRTDWNLAADCDQGLLNLCGTQDIHAWPTGRLLMLCRVQGPWIAPPEPDAMCSNSAVTVICKAACVTGHHVA